MELAIRPADLHAASVALASCSQRLADAGSTFARCARMDIPDIGVKVAAATDHAILTTEHAIEIVTTDINRIARALGALAHHYEQVDATAVSRR